MALVHYSLTLAAAVQRVSTGLGIAVGGPADIGFRQLILSTAGADAYVGGPTVSTSDYGRVLDSADAENETVLGPFEAGPLRLSDLYAVGAGATLHILGIPY